MFFSFFHKNEYKKRCPPIKMMKHPVWQYFLVWEHTSRNEICCLPPKSSFSYIKSKAPKFPQIRSPITQSIAYYSGTYSIAPEFYHSFPHWVLVWEFGQNQRKPRVFKASNLCPYYNSIVYSSYNSGCFHALYSLCRFGWWFLFSSLLSACVCKIFSRMCDFSYVRYFGFC